MAKQRRARSRPRTSKPATSTPVRSKAPAPSSGPARTPITRPSYVQAVALYEQGLTALQAHDYSRAAELLGSVLTSFPEEKELHERVRLYLNICDRQAVPRESTPRTAEERIYAATLAVNAGNSDQARQLLRSVVEENPEDDHAHYMLAVVHALRGGLAEAVPHLLRAIDLNPENRLLARQDPDLEALRQHATVKSVLEAAGAGRADRRRPARTRQSR